MEQGFLSPPEWLNLAPSAVEHKFSRTELIAVQSTEL